VAHDHEGQHDMETISVDNPWARSAPPNAPILGAFMEISNHSDGQFYVAQGVYSL
jgi:copper(I)-binding protein